MMKTKYFGELNRMCELSSVEEGECESCAV
jgi:hypothetical protein